MKRSLFLLAIIIAVLMSSCSSEDYKTYVPADSKLVGKVDLKAFFSQTGVDQDKLFKDMAEQYGDEFASIKESGIDATTPFYIFAKNKGSEIVFGIVGKLENREMFEKFAAKEMKKSLEKTGDFSCNVESDGGLGVNDEVFVFVAKTSNDKDAIKTELAKIMNKEGEGNIAENKIFAKAEGNSSFLSLYTDLSIIPEDYVSMAGSQTGVDSDKIKDLREMIVGINGNASDGICDFKASVKSDNSAVQEKIDKCLKAFGVISDKAIKAFSEDDMFGLALNTDGEQLVNYITESLNSDDSNGGAAMIKQVFGMFSSILSKIRGNVTFAMRNPSDFMFKAEGKNITNDIVSSINEMQPSAVSATPTGYCYDNQYWFGYADNNFYVTGSQMLAQEPSKLMGSSVPSALTSLMKDRRQVIFGNVSKLTSLASLASSSSDKDLKAFKEVTDKVKYVTISFK